MDFYAVSTFDKDPVRMQEASLQKEIDAWKGGQREWMDAAPNAKPRYILANHEDRLEKWLFRHPGLDSLDALRIPYLLGLKELGIEWERGKKGMANREVVVGNLVIRHGEIVRKHAGHAAKAELEKDFFSHSIMVGHTHRGGSYFATTPRGIVQAHECFCLCSLDPPYLAAIPNWQQGIALAEVSGANVSVDLVPFHSRRNRVVAIWRGKEYQS